MVAGDAQKWWRMVTAHLEVRHRVPARVVQHDDVRGREVDALAAGLGRDEGEPRRCGQLLHGG